MATNSFDDNAPSLSTSIPSENHSNAHLTDTDFDLTAPAAPEDGAPENLEALCLPGRDGAAHLPVRLGVLRHLFLPARSRARLAFGVDGRLSGQPRLPAGLLCPAGAGRVRPVFALGIAARKKRTC